MKQLIRQLCDILAGGEDLVLATVSSKNGSAPRMAGARMIVRQDGRIAGTIGGGKVEAVAIAESVQAFAHKNSGRCFFDLTNADAAGTDMICGGTMEIFLDYIAAGPANLQVFSTLLTALDSGRRVSFVSKLNDRDGGGARFVIADGGKTNYSQAPEALLSAVKKLRLSSSAPSVVTHDNEEYLVSYFAIPGDLFLLGAGHVAACTAEAAARVGFKVIVMDDRSEFANRQRFPMADEVVVLDSFADCFQGYDISHDSYLVIVTRGHMHDRDVLEQALSTNAGYVGMIGSRKKRDAIYTNLLAKGTAPEQLGRVHCPIGLAIEADTPEEIAVSIVGELIQQRARGQNRGK
ncbi:MAG: XdhC/CoxI family protein [Desulfurivibrio sp.]|jgi:xanthine dehydrogenase accessory factor|nr:MAG: XdhC/CoxI family protein [Desulfurivibrio sp.]